MDSTTVYEGDSYPSIISEIITSVLVWLAFASVLFGKTIITALYLYTDLGEQWFGLRLLSYQQELKHSAFKKESYREGYADPEETVDLFLEDAGDPVSSDSVFVSGA